MPAITKEQLQNQINTYIAQRDGLAGNFNAINGAIKDCEQWLAYLDAPEPQAEAAPPAEAAK